MRIASLASRADVGRSATCTYKELSQAIHCKRDQRRLVKRGRIILKGIKIVAANPGIMLGHTLDDARHAQPRVPAIAEDPMDKYHE